MVDDRVILEVRESMVIPAGGFKCPNCEACLLTPRGFVLIPGEGQCQVCRAWYRVTPEAARAGNTARDAFILAEIMLDSPGARAFERPDGVSIPRDGSEESKKKRAGPAKRLFPGTN